MACFKTGAVVHMLSHDIVFAADLYKVAGAVVLRSNGPLHRGKNCWSLAESKHVGFREPTHELRNSVVGEEFWREELGLFVVPEDRVTVLRPTKEGA